MNYENFISYRYLKASKGRFLTFLNLISIAGIAIGVASLIVVLAVMTGFGKNLREKIIGTTPHIMLEKESGIKDYDKLRTKIDKLKGVKGSSAYIQGNVYLEDAGQAVGLVVRGVEKKSENAVTKVNQYMIKGDLADLTPDGIIIGSELARFFGYDVGDKVTLIAPSSGIAGEGWRYTFTVVGIFTTGMADYDMNLVITDLAKTQQMFQIAPDKASGIGISLNNPYDAPKVKNALYGILGYGYIVKTWIDINRNLFEALFLEKWGLFIILTLMVIVASFNIISTLIVTVTSKTQDIGILQSIGVPKKSIRRIFTKQGLFIGGLGTFWGVVSGFVICYLLRTYIQVPKEIYTIDHVPVDIEAWDMTVIIAAALVICFLATIYPAAKAASLQPVDALRYE